MDRLPLVPKCEEDHDVLPILTEVLQDVLRTHQYPKNVAQNYKKYKIDGDYCDLQETGITTVKILEDTKALEDGFTMVEEQIMKHRAIAIIEQYQELPHLEHLKLKRRQFIQDVSKYMQNYKLIQEADVCKNVIEQYLDFTFNRFLHTCKPCLSEKIKEMPIVPKQKKRAKKIQTKTEETPFVLKPDKINFHNYQLGQTYTDKFKLRNITTKPQRFLYTGFPKESHFRSKMLADTCYLAPGMCAEFLVTFQPQMYKDTTEFVKFKTCNGVDLIVTVSNSRDPPKLTCYVVNVLLPFDAVQKAHPNSKSFSESRRTALNFTIDCGTCLPGTFAMFSVIMKNESQKGRFLITTEDEWHFTDLNIDGTRSLELTQGCFTIFPTLFEIDEGEITQIFVLFVPEKEGFFTQKFFIICDNNSYQEMEVMGDCMTFDYNLLTVHMYLMDNTFTYCRRSVSITLAPHETTGFVLSVTNESPLNFTYYWALKHDTDEYKENNRMDPDWISITNITRLLPPFSTTDTVVKLTAETEVEGSYYIYLSLFLKDIPSATTSKSVTIITDEDLETKKHSHLDIGLSKETEDNNQVQTRYMLSDVHIFELGIFCWVEIPEVIPEETVERKIQVKRKAVNKQKLGLSKKIINFGVIPKGVEIKKSFYVKNLTKEKVVWKLVEVRLKGTEFHVSEKLSCFEGTLKRNSLRKITYTIEAKDCTQWISLLILFSCHDGTWQKFIVEDVSTVICHIAEIKVSLTTDNNLAVLCPKEFLYVGIPSVHTVYVNNSGQLPGCFYFFKPKGTHSDRIRIRLKPQSGVVPPDATTEIKVELTPLENGIYDDINIPCFVGDMEKLISLRILCSASFINVYFYLPNKEEGYNKILWPPKKEMPMWNFQMDVGENVSLAGEGWTMDNPEETSAGTSTDDVFFEIATNDSVVATYPTVRVKQVEVKKPFKLTFYVENLTPIQSNFTVSPSNYGPESDCVNHILVKAKTRRPEFFWDKSCLDGCGIVVEPAHYSRDILAFQLVEIDLWIYANTWGKYLEEMIIEINDLTPFCFNLLIQVHGLPIEFPFARNTILPCPTLRFENIAYATENNTKKFTVTNISAIPVHINWYVFHAEKQSSEIEAPFNFLLSFNEDTPEVIVPKEFHGLEACYWCINAEPSVLLVEKQSTVTMSVTVNTTGFVPISEKTHIKYNLIGYIGASNCDKFKENYFKRDSGIAKVEVLVTMQWPVMQVDLTSDEKTIDIFVNDVLLSKCEFPEIYLILRNMDVTPVEFSIDIEKPFKIIEARTVPTGITDRNNLILHRNECLQVMLTCYISNEELLQYADLIYQRGEFEYVTTENFISVITKDLNIYQIGVPRQMIPFQIRLHYPHIEVKPHFIKFGHTLLYRPKKSSITIYNMTGSNVQFEILKTTKCEDFEVYPNHGDIPKSTGVNKQFIDVAVFFTPTRCKLYMECLRILTNIPQYYIDLPVAGHGSNDEKFDINCFY